MTRVLLLFAAAFSTLAFADMPTITTVGYCTELANPDQPGSYFVILRTFYSNRAKKNLGQAGVGQFEQGPGGKGPGDIIVCPVERETTGGDPVSSPDGTVIGYQSLPAFDLKLDGAPGGQPVTAHLTSEFHQVNDHAMLCTFGQEFPYRCKPHPYFGE